MKFSSWRSGIPGLQFSFLAVSVFRCHGSSRPSGFFGFLASPRRCRLYGDRFGVSRNRAPEPFPDFSRSPHRQDISPASPIRGEIPFPLMCPPTASLSQELWLDFRRSIFYREIPATPSPRVALQRKFPPRLFLTFFFSCKAPRGFFLP